MLIEGPPNSGTNFRPTRSPGRPLPSEPRETRPSLPDVRCLQQQENVQRNACFKISKAVKTANVFELRILGSSHLPQNPQGLRNSGFVFSLSLSLDSGTRRVACATRQIFPCKV